MLTNFFQVTSLPENNEKKTADSFSLLCASMLFKSLVEIYVEIESRLHSIDI